MKCDEHDRRIVAGEPPLDLEDEVDSRVAPVVAKVAKVDVIDNTNSNTSNGAYDPETKTCYKYQGS